MTSKHIIFFNLNASKESHRNIHQTMNIRLSLMYAKNNKNSKHIQYQICMYK